MNDVKTEKQPWRQGLPQKKESEKLADPTVE
jgi:hypothetical protein